MSKKKISLKEYEAFAKSYKPPRLTPRKWLGLIKDSFPIAFKVITSGRVNWNAGEKIPPLNELIKKKNNKE